MEGLLEFEIFYDDPESIIDESYKMDYNGIEFEGNIYPGFSNLIDNKVIKSKLEELLPDYDIENVEVMFRKGTDYRNLIHADGNVKSHAAVIYLSDDIATAFWKHRELEIDEQSDDQNINMKIDEDSNNLEKWELVGKTSGKFNSISIYPSNKIHSIYPYENKDDRLTQVVFFDLKEKSEYTVDIFDAKKHYEIISNWWKAQGWSPIPLEFLPSTGAIAFHKDIPVAASFLYTTDSKFGFLEWTVGNPEVHYSIRGEGLDKVIEKILQFSRILDVRGISTTTQSRRLVSRLENHQFIKTDEDMISAVYTMGVK